MKKNELIQALVDYPEDAEIVLWKWDGHQSTFEYLNITCDSFAGRGDKIHPDYFALSHSYCPFTPAEDAKEKGPAEDDRQLGDLKPKRVRKARNKA